MYLIEVNFNKNNKYINNKFSFKKKELSIFFKNKKNISIKYNNFFFCLIDGLVNDNLDKELSIEVIFNTLSKLKNKKDLEKFLNSLSGAFHLFFYSFTKKNFLLFGDKDGWKQIFYNNDNKKKIFYLSPVPNFIKSLHKPKKLNKVFFLKYILCRYNFLYGKKNTFFKDLNLLETGKYLYADKKKTLLSRFNYLKIKINNHVSYEDSKLQAYRLIKENFHKQRKRFNDNCVLALSGGLDSTSAAVFLKEIDKPVHSFTAKYEVDIPINEFKKAKLVAKRFCKSWSPIVITSNDFLNFWKKCYDHHDFPLPTSSSLGYEILYSKVFKLGYKSIINAGVPDNLFLGNYPNYLYNLCDLYKTKSKKFNQELRCWIKNHSTKVFPKNKNIFRKFFEKNIVKSKKFTIQPKMEIVGAKYLKKKNNKKLISDTLSKFTSSSYINAYQIFSVWNADRAPGIFLNSEIEKKTKVVSIDPFVSEKVQNYIFSLPTEYKIKNAIGKVMLRDMMKKKLPTEIIENKSKTGFDVPFQHWVKKDKKLKEFVLNTIDLAENDNLFEFLELKKIKKDIKKNYQYNSMFVWQLVNSIMWLKKNKF